MATIVWKLLAGEAVGFDDLSEIDPQAARVLAVRDCIPPRLCCHGVMAMCARMTMS